MSCNWQSIALMFGLSVIQLLAACAPSTELNASTPTAIRSSARSPTETPKGSPSLSSAPTLSPSANPTGAAIRSPSQSSNPVISFANLDRLTIVRAFGPIQGNAEIDGAVPSPDSKMIAVFGSSPNIELRDLVSGQPVRTFATGNNVSVRFIRFSPDGRFLAASAKGYSGESAIQLWNATTGRLLWSHPVGLREESSMGFSADNKILASGSVFRSAIQLWDVSSGQVTKQLDNPKNRIYQLAFNPVNERQLALVTDLNTQVWDVVTGQSQTVNPVDHSCCSDGTQPWPRQLAFSPDGKRLAIGYLDRTVELLDVASNERQVLAKQYLSHLAFSSLGRGEMLATVDHDSKGRNFSLSLTDSRAGKAYYSFSPPELDETLDSLALTPDGRYILTAANSQNAGSKVYVWGIPP